MDALVPLLFANPREARFWLQPPGFDHIRRLLLAVAGLPRIRRVLVVTPDAGQWRNLKSGAIEVLASDGPLDMDGDLLSNAPRLAAVAAAGASSRDMDMVCLDVRNPSLGTGMVAQALAAYDAKACPLLVSVCAVVDHPCQFVRYSRVLDAGMIHLSDPGPMAPEGTAPVVRRDTSGRAWLAFPHLAGRGSAHMVIQPFRAGDGPPIPPRTLPIRLGEAGGIPLDADIAAADGLVFAVLRFTDSGPYDLVERIDPLETLWRYDASGGCINAGSGVRILGRQDFPDLFELDGSFLVTTVSRARDAETLYAGGRAAGRVIAQPLARIYTENDAKLVRARLRASRG